MSAPKMIPQDRFPGRVGVQQRILPAYRRRFFDMMAGACSGGLQVFAGEPQARESVVAGGELRVAGYFPAQNVHIFPVESPFCQVWQRGVIDWLEAWDPQALILEANPRLWSNRLAQRWMQQQKRPVIGWGLGAPQRGGVLGALELASKKRYLLGFQAIVSYSQSGAQEFIQLGIPQDKVFVAPNAVAPRPQSLPAAKPEEIAGPAKVLFVGRLQERKRVDLLLQACAALPEALQPQLTIVGDGPARGMLKTFAAQIYPQTVFAGAKTGAEAQVYFEAADLFVLPGTGGLAIQEAMAYGLPVIVAEGDGTQNDLVRPGNGWLVPPGELQALTAALSDALSDGKRLRQMGKESLRIVLDEVNLETMVSVFIRALCSTL